MGNTLKWNKLEWQNQTLATRTTILRKSLKFHRWQWCNDDIMEPSIQHDQCSTMFDENQPGWQRNVNQGNSQSHSGYKSYFIKDVTGAIHKCSLVHNWGIFCSGSTTWFTGRKSACNSELSLNSWQGSKNIWAFFSYKWKNRSSKWTSIPRFGRTFLCRNCAVIWNTIQKIGQDILCGIGDSVTVLCRQSKIRYHMQRELRSYEKNLLT